MNIMKRLEELNRKEDQFYTMSPDEINDISIELEKLKTLLEWLQEQLKNIDEGGYNTESKRVAFNMKNTTPYCFKKVAFPMLISNKDTAPVEIFNWSQDEVKEIDLIERMLSACECIELLQQLILILFHKAPFIPPPARFGFRIQCGCIKTF